MDSDASNLGLGAVLTQRFEGKEYPVVVLSRKLKIAEKNYSISEKEILAALWAMEQLHYYLYGRKFILRTDHKALEALNIKGEVKSKRIERWLSRLQNYSFKVEYRKGSDQGNADTLSRCFEIDEIRREHKDLIWQIHHKLIHRGAKMTKDVIQEETGIILPLRVVRMELKKCLKCKQFSPRIYPGIRFNEAFEVGEKVAIDVLGPIEDQYIIAGIDYFRERGLLWL